MTDLDLLRVLNCIVFAVVYILCFFPRYRKKGARYAIVYTLFFLYLELLLFFTIFPIIFTFDAPSINLIPFRDYFFAFGDYQRQIILNVLLFVPYGFFLPFCVGKDWKKTCLIGVCTTLAIELAQPWVTINRVCDITDVITNSFGTFLGYWCHFFLRPILSKYFTWLN